MSAWKKVDLPTLGRPTIPDYTCQNKFYEGCALRLFPGRPRRSFFSVAAFLGGIFFFTRGEEVEKNKETVGDEAKGRERGKRPRRNRLMVDGYVSGDTVMIGKKIHQEDPECRESHQKFPQS